MKKRYLLTFLFVTTILSADQNNVNAQTGEIDAQPEQSSEKPVAPKTIKVLKQEFKNLNKVIAVIDKLSEREKQNNAKLAKATQNYKIASDNFNAVLEIKTLTEDIHKEQSCYVAYYRIQDLNKKIRVGSDDNILIYNEIKAPLQQFFKNCKNLRLDLLKKYKNK